MMLAVRMINTESPDWLDKLAQLPPQCVMVGGPLRAERYTAIKSRSIQQSRAVFAFLPSLEGSDEVTAAWRFFASPQDQINAVLKLTRSLGISSYGALAQTDTYGQRMTDLFLKAVRANDTAAKEAT